MSILEKAFRERIKKDKPSNSDGCIVGVDKHNHIGTSIFQYATIHLKKHINSETVIIMSKYYSKSVIKNHKGKILYDGRSKIKRKRTPLIEKAKEVNIVIGEE